MNFLLCKIFSFPGCAQLFDSWSWIVDQKQFQITFNDKIKVFLLFKHLSVINDKINHEQNPKKTKKLIIIYLLKIAQHLFENRSIQFQPHSSTTHSKLIDNQFKNAWNGKFCFVCPGSSKAFQKLKFN